MHLCIKQKLELTEMPQSCVNICMEYGMKEQTVWDNRITVRPSEILSFDREGTTHYAKRSPREPMVLILSNRVEFEPATC
jgi:hypothetical protein